MRPRPGGDEGREGGDIYLFDCYVDWQDLNRDTILTGVAVDCFTK